MKILQIMPEFGMAGAEIMCENLMKGLKRKGENVVAVSLYNYQSSITERIEQDGLKILYLNKKRGLDLTVYYKLYKVMKREKPDIIHTHRYVMQYAVPVAKILGIPCVHTVHSLAEKEQEKNKRVLAGFFYRKWKVQPVALSSEVQKSVEKEYGLKRERIPVIFNGEDLSNFEEKKEYEYSDIIRICHIGRFLPVKNQKMIIDVAEKLYGKNPKFQFFLIGDYSSEYGREVEREIRKREMSSYVKMIGVVGDVTTYLENTDVFILPSEYEGVPMTLIEAMASGLPIIASSVGGIKDMLVNEESALLIEPCKKALENALEKISADAKLREKLGKNAKKRSELFSYISMVEKYIEVYKRCIEK